MLHHALRGDIYLALIEKRHARKYFSFIEKNRARYTGILHFIEHIHTEQDTEDFIVQAQTAAAEGRTCVWGIWDREVIIGVVGARDIDEEFKSAELSYCMDQDYEGKGIMSEACGLLIRHLFAEYEMERLVIGCDVKNERSSRIAQKLGFSREGVERKSFVADGKFMDIARWSLLKEEYSMPSDGTGR